MDVILCQHFQCQTIRGFDLIFHRIIIIASSFSDAFDFLSLSVLLFNRHLVVISL